MTINEGNYCLVREIARFIVRHVTRFRPIACTHFKMRYNNRQESSAKLTNQRVSYAFTSSPLSFHAHHILPTSKFQHSYFTFFLYQWTACV